ncbi:hypothetical protein AWJ19_13400 [Paenibacillus sp. DMB5]|nr:hypothetical protein AWJ19_13400 [Paenibacillus sp. DMB5]
MGQMKGKNASDFASRSRMGQMKGKNAFDFGLRNRMGQMKGKNASDFGLRNRMGQMCEMNWCLKVFLGVRCVCIKSCSQKCNNIVVARHLYRYLCQRGDAYTFR